MVELIDLSKWKKQKEIIVELHREYGINISPRQWRAEVEKWNKAFSRGEKKYYITHSNSLGYKSTTEYQIAKIGRDDYLKRAFDMLRKARECDKAFNELKNFKYDFESGEII